MILKMIQPPMIPPKLPKTSLISKLRKLPMPSLISKLRKLPMPSLIGNKKLNVSRKKPMPGSSLRQTPKGIRN